MKKVLLVLALVFRTLVSSAQTDTTGFAYKMVDIFKRDVVNTSFKDPYSFQLLSVDYIPVTAAKKLEIQIMSDSIQLKVYNDMPKSTKIWLPKSYKEEQDAKAKLINSNKEILNKMSEDERNIVDHYTITIECRGANSYGLLVYSKYIGRYNQKNNSVDKFYNISK